MIFYIKTLHGIGSKIINVLFKQYHPLLLLKQNLPFQIQNIHFFTTVDGSLVSLEAVVFQLNEDNKLNLLSYNSRILNLQGQKLSTLNRKLLGIVHALQIYEFLFIIFPHPILVFTDYKPLIHCFTKKEILVHDFTELKGS